MSISHPLDCNSSETLIIWDDSEAINDDENNLTAKNIKHCKIALMSSHTSFTSFKLHNNIIIQPLISISDNKKKCSSYKNPQKAYPDFETEILKKCREIS